MNARSREEIVALLPRLQRYARSLANSADEADDLLQSTVERALRSVSKKHPDAPLDRWMFRMMKNIRLNQISKRTELSLDGHVHNGFEAIENPLDGVRYFEARLTLNAVRRAFTQLSELHREVLYLICVEGFAYKEAAELLDVPIGTIMSRLARARIALHQLLVGDGRVGAIEIGSEDDEAF